MRRVLLAALLAGCGTPEAPPPVADDWTDFEVGEIADVTTRFLRQEPFVPSAEDRADVEVRCPRIRRGKAEKETENFALLTVEGEHLDQVALTNAWLPDDKLAVAQHDLRDGALVMPVGCEACTLVFGVALPGGRIAACTGPGFSLTIQGGRLTSP